MKMTAEEIVKVYKSHPSRETMKQLAVDNECTIKEIGIFLRDAAKNINKAEKSEKQPAEKKKSGRPKGSGQKIKKPKCMPESVRYLIEQRLIVLEKKREMFIAEITEIDKEVSEISDFLKD